MEKEIKDRFQKKNPSTDEPVARARKKDKKKEGETFYKAHPIAQPMGMAGVREVSTTSMKVERVLWWGLGVLEAFLLLRIVFAAVGATGGNIITSLVYAVTYPFVWFFFYLFNTLDRITVTAPTFELETLAAMSFYYIVVYIITSLIEGFRSTE